jgi:hypothetical protein
MYTYVVYVLTYMFVFALARVCVCVLRVCVCVCVCVCVDGKWVVSGDEDGLVRVWDLSAGKQLYDYAHAGVFFLFFCDIYTHIYILCMCVCV